jgi:hypothetical protein
MGKIEARSTKLAIAISRPTIPEAITIYNQCKQAIDVPHDSNKKRQRRTGQLAWITLVAILRQSQIEKLIIKIDNR